MANKYNHYNPKKDYDFLLKMFNMKNEGSTKQRDKIKAIYLNSIVPFVKEYVKIKKTNDNNCRS